jgi:hypothetical protein
VCVVSNERRRIGDNELAGLNTSKAHSLALRLERLKVLFIDEFSKVASEYRVSRRL